MLLEILKKGELKLKVENQLQVYTDVFNSQGAKVQNIKTQKLYYTPLRKLAQK